MKKLILGIALLLIATTVSATTVCPEKIQFSISEKSKCPDSCYIKPDQRIIFNLTDTYPGMDVVITQKATGDKTESINKESCPKTITKIAEMKERPDGGLFDSFQCKNESNSWIRADFSKINSYAPTEELEKYGGYFKMTIQCCVLEIKNGTSYCK